MNQRARHLIEKQKSSLKQSAEKLRALLDNPDDFQLGSDGEVDIRNAIGMLKDVEHLLVVHTRPS